ncbi:MAG: hypothetical protein LBE35_06995 [Clostridiales bacterium]|jgi:hypothetical protein|nr:hypothetical protein [Clostridiales bacterium]
MEMILETRALPEQIFRLFESSNVKVEKEGDKVILSPALVVDERGYPLRGSFKDCGFTVDEFLAMTREDKELERF